MAPSQDDMKSSIQSSNLTVSESDTDGPSKSSSKPPSNTKEQPSQEDIKSSIQSSNLTVSESDTDVSSCNTKEQPKKSLKELAKENPTQLGDPVSLKAETSDHEPTDQDRGAKGKDGDLAGAPKRGSKL